MRRLVNHHSSCCMVDPQKPANISSCPSADYPNSQNGRTLWYHDHAVGVTAENAYYGQAGFYLIRDSVEQNMPGLPQGMTKWGQGLCLHIISLC